MYTFTSQKLVQKKIRKMQMNAVEKKSVWEKER